MLVGVFQAAVALVTGPVYYAVDSWLIRKYDRERAEEGTGRSWGYTAFMVFLQPLRSKRSFFWNWCAIMCHAPPYFP